MSKLVDTSLPPSPNHAEDEDDLYDDDDDDDDDEEEEDEERDPHAALVDRVRSDNRNNREALAYLLRYETMVRQQEAEDMATMSHLRPCLERLNELLPHEMRQYHHQQQQPDHHSDAGDSPSSTKDDPDTVWTRQFSYRGLRKALEVLESQGPTEFMTTDRQLMMILRLLTQSEREKSALTWAELVQCYKTCIAGMTTLQHLPNADETRQRARDRTLAMLALFEPQSRLWSASPLAPVRPMANTSALYRSQRSSFAPPRVVKTPKTHHIRRFVTCLVVFVTTGLYYRYWQQRQQHDIVPAATVGLSTEVNTKRSGSTPVATSRSAPTFAVRTMVPTSMTTSASMKAQPAPFQHVETDYHDGLEEVGVTGPALLVATLGTPVMVVAAQTLLQQFGSGAAFVAAFSSVAVVGNVIVTAAGFLSLTSLFYSNLRAIVRGLRRLGTDGEAEIS